MQTSGREIEQKFVVIGETLDSAVAKLSSYYPTPLSLQLRCETDDEYWAVPCGFVRLRNSWGSLLDGTPRELRELTVKSKDKGNNFDRIEYNVKVDSLEDARGFASTLAGTVLGHVTKTEYVLFGSKGLVLSLSEVNNVVYLEVEGPKASQVIAEAQELKSLFVLEREPRSLFEIFIKRKAA